MFSLPGKLVALALALTLSLAPALAVTDLAAYQRVKNITAGDPVAGSVYTMAQPGDELRHLVFAYNKSNLERDVTIRITIPQPLALTPGSGSLYRDGSWRAARSDGEVTVHLLPFEFAFYRFTTTVPQNFPNDNAVLTTIATITTGDVTEPTVSRVYVPNFHATRALPDEAKKLTPEEQAHLKQALEEEKRFMEAEFAKLAQQTMEIDPTLPLPPPEEADDSLLITLVIFVGLTLVSAGSWYFIRTRHARL